MRNAELGIEVAFCGAKIFIRFLGSSSVKLRLTPSPTGEGLRMLSFQQQLDTKHIFNIHIGRAHKSNEGSLREGAPVGDGWRSTRA